MKATKKFALTAMVMSMAAASFATQAETVTPGVPHLSDVLRVTDVTGAVHTQTTDDTGPAAVGGQEKRLLIEGDVVGTIIDDVDVIHRVITGAVFLTEPKTVLGTADDVILATPNGPRVLSDIVYSFDLFAGPDANHMRPIAFNNIIMLSDGAFGFKDTFGRILNSLDGGLGLLEENGSMQDVTQFLHGGQNVAKVEVFSDLEPVPVPGALLLFGSALPLVLRGRKKASAV